MSSQTCVQYEQANRTEAESHARQVVLLRIVRQLTDESNPDVLMRCLLDEAIVLLRGQVGSVACWSEEEQVLKRVWSTIPLVDGRPVDIVQGKGSAVRWSSRADRSSPTTTPPIRRRLGLPGEPDCGRASPRRCCGTASSSAPS